MNRLLLNGNTFSAPPFGPIIIPDSIELHCGDYTSSEVLGYEKTKERKIILEKVKELGVDLPKNYSFGESEGNYTFRDISINQIVFKLPFTRVVIPKFPDYKKFIRIILKDPRSKEVFVGLEENGQERVDILIKNFSIIDLEGVLIKPHDVGVSRGVTVLNIGVEVGYTSDYKFSYQE